ncbi:PREDICTED: protein SAWADEE HOMEODOMAIN HOMOLOG 1 isoform X2 [Tarenaya hassleriana]|uniref:protein SAWADEE HOMEODOMAIN HOMOLOG 1 isoform X2 n=1 Tax=Tarenaya hassleriana TaxID=28532 RepID=UPI00053C7EC5|nr:PREDICTED: protein SAWADEE HOMEODOMAIN HOMOLOG 1 isoform X2 [Tarenaya hassleriana]
MMFLSFASSFFDLSCSGNRNGKSSITWKQVHTWFKEKLKQQKPFKVRASPPSPPASPPLQCLVDLPNLSYTGSAAYGQRRKGKFSDISGLAYEARSARDNAWYDVTSFLTYRFLHTGELEVRVRFTGFDNEHDEWVNVRTSVRERSIPLEPSECGKVNVGDLVLCFQEREHQAVYCDARVVNIKRGFHDHRACSCIFMVRYDHEDSEETVGLERVCCRPAD